MTERIASTVSADGFWWGWGSRSRLPDDDARAGLAQMVAAVLGIEAPRVRPLPSPDDARVPDARIAVPDELAAFCSAERDERAAHTYGKAFPDLVRGFCGDYASAPDLVARPRDEAEVERALAFCARARVACVPFGGGTSVVGGVECARPDGYNGVLSLDLRAMDRVLEVDAVSLAARIQAGATGPTIESQLAPHGLSLRHYPQSFEWSTLGGWIATRAGGHFATLYTHIDDRVEAVRMLTPSAGAWQSRRLPASGAGPSPDRFVLGSEGTLGVITEAWVRVLPRPRFRASASAHFERFEQAVAAARALAQSGLHPANCRLLDADEARLNAVTADGHHVLLLGFESADHAPRAAIERAVELCKDHGGVCVGEPRVRESTAGAREGDAGSWREAFVNAPYLQSALVTLGLVVDTFETACTWAGFDAMHAAVGRAVRDAMREACGGGHLSCRFTHVYPDGPAPYYTFIAPGRAGVELSQWAAIKRAASDALEAHGATITHHHAVGRTHRPWYDRERPEPFARALEGAKRAVDAAWVMNPGVLLDPR